MGGGTQTTTGRVNKIFLEHMIVSLTTRCSIIDNVCVCPISNQYQESELQLTN